MELRHFRYFLAVAEELHFGRAAKRLHIAQPPLSQQIRKVEEELGVRLFERTKRRVELTHAGRVLLGEARHVVSRAEGAAEAARRAGRGQVGSLVVACGPLAAYAVLPLVLPAFRARYPEVDLRLREFVMKEIVQSLEDASVDLGLLVPYFESQALKRETIFTIPMVAALSTRHPYATRRRLRLNKLASEPFVVFAPGRGSGFYEHAVGVCQRAGFTPDIVQTAGQIPTLLAMVGAGYGVALVPSLLAPTAGKDVAIVEIKERPMVQLCMAWRANNSSPVLAGFLDVVRACTKKR